MCLQICIEIPDYIISITSVLFSFVSNFSFFLSLPLSPFLFTVKRALCSRNWVCWKECICIFIMPKKAWKIVRNRPKAAANEKHFKSELQLLAVIWFAIAQLWPLAFHECFMQQSQSEEVEARTSGECAEFSTQFFLRLSFTSNMQMRLM